MVQLVEIDGDHGLAIVAAGSWQAMAFDDGAGGLACGAEAFGEVVLGYLFGSHD